LEETGKLYISGLSAVSTIRPFIILVLVSSIKFKYANLMLIIIKRKNSIDNYTDTKCKRYVGDKVIILADV